MTDPKILQRNMHIYSKIAFTVGAGTYLIKSQFISLIPTNSFIPETLDLIFVLSFFSAGLALLINGISSSSGEKGKESFQASFLEIIKKAFLYVLLPAVLITVIISLIFLR